MTSLPLFCSFAASPGVSVMLLLLGVRSMPACELLALMVMRMVMLVDASIVTVVPETLPVPLTLLYENVGVVALMPFVWQPPPLDMQLVPPSAMPYSYAVAD